MNAHFRALALSSVLGSAVLVFTGQTTFAHGHVEVGEYELGIGFSTEPAYVGQPNGLDLVVSKEVGGDPIAGLEETLQAELIRGSAKRTYDLEPEFGEEGAYTASVVPTEAGDYTWRIFGEIEGTPVDVSMTSGPDTFGPVAAMDEAAFPQPDASPAELEEMAASAGSSARMALALAALGTLLGGAALAQGMRGGRSKA